MNSKAKSKLLSLMKAALFTCACLVVSLAVILPLWAFASGAPRTYTALVALAAACLAAAKAAAWARKAGARNALRAALKCAVAAAGAFAALRLLLSFRRGLALAAVVATAALFNLADMAFRKPREPKC